MEERQDWRQATRPKTPLARRSPLELEVHVPRKIKAATPQQRYSLSAILTFEPLSINPRILGKGPLAMCLGL